MFKVEKYLAMPKEIEIDGEKVMVYPLDLDSIDLAFKLSIDNIDIQAEAYKEMLIRTILRMDPSSNRDQIKKMGIQSASKILEAMVEVNNVGEISEEEKEKILSKFKSLR